MSTGFAMVDPEQLKLQLVGKIVSPSDLCGTINASRTYNMGAMEVKEGSSLRRALEEDFRDNPKYWVQINGDKSNLASSELLVLGAMRVEDERGSRQHLVMSGDGRKGWMIRTKEVLGPLSEKCRGFEDWRAHEGGIFTIVRFGETPFGNMYQTEIKRLAYRDGFVVDHIGTMGLPGIKDTVLMRRNGGFIAHCRPHINGCQDIVYATSLDLKHWSWEDGYGNINVVLSASGFGSECKGIGANGPAIYVSPRRGLPKGGYLLLIHARDSNRNYFIGAIMLSKDDPSKVTHIPSCFFLGPEISQHLGQGEDEGVLFNNAQVVDNACDEIILYVSIRDIEQWVWSLSFTSLIDYVLQFPVFG